MILQPTSKARIFLQPLHIVLLLLEFRELKGHLLYLFLFLYLSKNLSVV